MPETTAIDPTSIGMEVRLGRTSRENVETKGRRYLIEGRLQLRFYGKAQITALCKGTETTHYLGYERGSWFCSCEARGRCSHLVALQLVAPRPEDPQLPPNGWNA